MFLTDLASLLNLLLWLLHVPISTENLLPIMHQHDQLQILLNNCTKHKDGHPSLAGLNHTCVEAQRSKIILSLKKYNMELNCGNICCSCFLVCVVLGIEPTS